MSFWQKVKDSMARLMIGRHGTDHLGVCTLIAGLVLSLVGSMAGGSAAGGMLSFLGLALYILTIFRMMSRNQEARIRENQQYLAITGKWTTKVRQFCLRIKKRKEYKYFKCPGCKQLLRLKRGCGEKQITCAKCGHQFTQKA